MPIVFRREDGARDLGKSCGLTRELQLGDSEFDGVVVIDSDAPASYVRSVLAQKSARSAILELVRTAFSPVRVNENEPKVEVLYIDHSFKADGLATLLDSLATLRRCLPLFTPERNRMRRGTDVAVPVLGALTVGYGCAVAAADGWPMVDVLPYVYGILAGLVLWCVYALVIWWVSRGGARALRTLAMGVVPALFGIPLGTLGLLAYVNGAHDPHGLDRHEVEVSEKLSVHKESDVVYKLRVGDWRAEGGLLVEVQVARELWEQVQQGESVVVRAGRGRLGWTWIDGVGR